MGYKHTEETKRNISKAKRRIHITREWLEEHYINKKMSVYECSDILGCSGGTIWKRLNEYNIPTRSYSEASKNQVISDDTRKKLSESVRESHRKCPRKHSEETKKKISKSIRGKNHPLYGKKHSSTSIKQMSKVKVGSNNPNWKGGISSEPYCIKFNNKIKEDIRKRYDRKCFICGSTEHTRRHAIHHVDYNKNTLCNGRTWGLIPLCHSCHSKTNFNRWYWFGLLGNYWVYPYIEEDLFCSLY